jgi:hypothetical protein
MSVSASALSEDSDQLLLRWSEGSSSTSREEFVDVLSRQSSRIVVRSQSPIVADTPLYLAGKQYTVSGIARSCRKDAASFILAILIDKESRVQSVNRSDPGVFAIEDFLTEEEEAEILKNLDEDNRASAAFGG